MNVPALVFIKAWMGTRCNERRHKDVLISIDLDDTRACYTTSVHYLMPVGIELIEEAKAQVEYGSYMKKLGTYLPNKTYKTVGCDSAPGMMTLFSDATKLCKENPNFQSLIIVALLRGGGDKILPP
eukprot:6738076-Ditylum_brightwellii.AAC.1